MTVTVPDVRSIAAGCRRRRRARRCVRRAQGPYGVLTLRGSAAGQLAAAAHPSESAAGALVATPSLASLLTGNVLQDGEVILLLLKPSAWFVVLASLRFSAVVVLLLITAAFLPGSDVRGVEVGVFLIVARLMWAVLQWMSRLYILTDLRIMRLAGVFNADVFECPLRKVAGTRVIRTLGERVVGVGSIEILPQGASVPGMWQMVRHPIQVHERITAAIGRAKQCGRG